MLIQCETCGKVKKYGEWIGPDNELKRVLQDIKIIKTECPNCKGMKADVSRTRTTD